MKYTRPIYENEMVETADIMEESIVSIAYVKKKVIDETTNEEIEVTATQVTVDVSNLF